MFFCLIFLSPNTVGMSYYGSRVRQPARKTRGHAPLSILRISLRYGRDKSRPYNWGVSSQYGDAVGLWHCRSLSLSRNKGACLLVNVCEYRCVMDAMNRVRTPKKQNNTTIIISIKTYNKNNLTKPILFRNKMLIL